MVDVFNWIGDDQIDLMNQEDVLDWLDQEAYWSLIPNEFINTKGALKKKLTLDQLKKILKVCKVNISYSYFLIIYISNLIIKGVANDYNDQYKGEFEEKAEIILSQIIRQRSSYPVYAFCLVLSLSFNNILQANIISVLSKLRAFFLRISLVTSAL